MPERGEPGSLPEDNQEKELTPAQMWVRVVGFQGKKIAFIDDNGEFREGWQLKGANKANGTVEIKHSETGDVKTGISFSTFLGWQNEWKKHEEQK